MVFLNNEGSASILDGLGGLIGNGALFGISLACHKSESTLCSNELPIHFHSLLYAVKKASNRLLSTGPHMRVELRFRSDIRKLKSPLYSRQCVGLLDVKPGFEVQTRHQNKIQKVFLRRFPLSRFLARTLRANKSAMKSFSKKSVVRSRLMYKINTHNISCVR